MKSQIRFAQFCDDIRQEINGKWILIGCYGSNMVVSSFPYNNSISCFVTGACDPETKSADIEYSLASGAVIGRMHMEIIAIVGDKPDIIQLPVPPLPISLSRGDELILKLRFGDEEMQEVGRLRVEQGDVSKLTQGQAMQ